MKHNLKMPQLSILVALILSKVELSDTEFKYVESRQTTYENLLDSVSANQFKMKYAICQPNFQVIDYFALIVGFIENERGLDVLLSLIDDTDELDDAVVKPRIMKMLLKASSSFAVASKHDVKRVIAHILTKFPDIRKMNFMFVKAKNDVPKPRFTDEDIKNFF